MKFVFFCLLSAFLAFIWGLKIEEKSSALSLVQTNTETPSLEDFPITEDKFFVFIVYGYNQADWCERSLSSILSQNYDHFRVLFIDDGSVDGTWEKAQSFVLDNHQEDRISLIRNESHLGEPISLYRVAEGCLDQEIIVPLQAKDWFAHDQVLRDLNRVYQNPDIWLTSSPSFFYPTYEIIKKSDRGSLFSFYSALFKQIQFKDLITEEASAYLSPLKQLAQSHYKNLETPHFFQNIAQPLTKVEETYKQQNYLSLNHLPQTTPTLEKTDILIFSFDRPLQLYACLESIDRYIQGYERLSVLYRASNIKFVAGYEKVKKKFPQVHFLAQSTQYKKDFKPILMKAVFDSPSKYILFGVDDIVVKDFTDMKRCMEWMEKTGAYGFYLRFGRHISDCYQSGTAQALPISFPLDHEVYAWQLDSGTYDWGFPNSLDMTLYRKSDLKKPFEKIKFKNPNSLEFCWANQCRPQEAIGLYFQMSKIINIPFNVVSQTGNPHMNYLSAEDLLLKFEEGLKMDITPLYQILNTSPHFEYLPEFISVEENVMSID